MERSIVFIDGFAGPGEYEGGEEGSPLIALRSYTDHRAKSQISARVAFVFLDERKDRVQHLRKVVTRIEAQLPATCKVSIVQGKFDEKMTKLLDSPDDRQSWLAPSFVMIDPFGVSDTPMKLIGRILQSARCEVYISFMYEPIKRFIETPAFAPNLDKLFGSTAWREAKRLTGPEEKKRFLFDLYREQLRDAGAEHVVHFELYEENRLIYAIFFGTQNWQGSDAMKEAIWKVTSADFEFHGTRSRQLALDINRPDFESLRSTLRNKSADRATSELRTSLSSWGLIERTTTQESSKRRR